MTTDFLFVYIVLIHFLADFGLQTHEQAVNKSSNSTFLFYHVGVYSLIWLIATIPLLSYHARFLGFTMITFITHFWIDYVTSKIGKPFWEKKDLHNGFVVIGFDQILHLIQLWYTFKLFNL